MITSQQFDEMQRRISAKAVLDSLPVSKESQLHDEIEATLKFKRWFYVHSRMDRATTTKLGTPDFIIAAPDGRTFWIECKRKGGKLTPEQSITRHILLALGHTFAVVYNHQEFLDVINSQHHQTRT